MLKNGPLAADQNAIIEIVRGLFTSASNHDIESFQSHITTDYFIYDGGKRFEGCAIVHFIAGMHKQGYGHAWSICDPIVEVDGNAAWMAYENRGSITTPDGVTRDQVWLESHVFVKRDGRWLLRFSHSTRAQ